jgi:hypothetical protein
MLPFWTGEASVQIASNVRKFFDAYEKCVCVRLNYINVTSGTTFGRELHDLYTLANIFSFKMPVLTEEVVGEQLELKYLITSSIEFLNHLRLCDVDLKCLRGESIREDKYSHKFHSPTRGEQEDKSCFVAFSEMLRFTLYDYLLKLSVKLGLCNLRYLFNLINTLNNVMDSLIYSVTINVAYILR